MLVNGDFERRSAEGYPYALTVKGGQIGIDPNKANSGYSSLLLKGAASGEAGFTFSPISTGGFKPGHQLTCSFFYHGERQQKGSVIAEMLDEQGKVLARKLAQIEFEAVPGKWLANSFAFKFDPQGAEVAAVKSLQLRVTASMPADASIWFDTFIMR
jgi:hypothetical protein